MPFCSRIAILLLAGAGIACAGDVPEPAATPARIIVSGRTSTAIDIAIVRIGQAVPATYAGAKMANTPGYEWYVSQHYALKTDLDEPFARKVLIISELALPHWEALTGLTPPDPEHTRMCIVYGKSVDDLNRSVRTDLNSFWKGDGGGVTLHANQSAYDYPSGTLEYHREDLVIHEDLHMLQGVAMPKNFGTEGFAYGAAQHVFDPKRNQLTVQVFDQAPINHFTEQGITRLQASLIPIQEMAALHWSEGGALGAVYSHFFWSDPDRWLKWCIWRDEFYAGRVSAETNLAVMTGIFGPLDALNEDWGRWIRDRRVTFHHIDWGWEQRGDELMAYGYPKDKDFWSQMDIWQSPGEASAYDPLRMDYPSEDQPAIVGRVKRGVPEPAIGFVVGGLNDGRCWGGFGLGVSGRSMCQVVIAGGTTLSIRGQHVPIEGRDVPLSAEVIAAARSDGGRFGVTITIRPDSLLVQVRSGPPTVIREMETMIPLTAEAHALLLSRPLSMVAKDGRPTITPYIDDARRKDADLRISAPANRWRFPAERELARVYRTIWVLGDQSPASLTRLRSEMLPLVDADAQAQGRAAPLFYHALGGIMDEAARIPGLSAAVAQHAIAELAGVTMMASLIRSDAGQGAQIAVVIRSSSDNAVNGTVAMQSSGATLTANDAATRQVSVPSGTSRLCTWPTSIDATTVGSCRIIAHLACGSVSVTIGGTLHDQ
jgi:hypothetical protein